VDPYLKLRWPVPRHTAELPYLASLASLASLVALTAFATALPALAQTSSEPAVTGDVPMADYLALLQQISPAAHQGAQAYLQAHERRCRRSLSSRELRQAMAEGDGDPLLMAMIRASHLQDGPGLTRLGEQVSCTRKAVR
jgi:hypothetical protein